MRIIPFLKKKTLDSTVEESFPRFHLSIAFILTVLVIVFLILQICDTKSNSLTNQEFLLYSFTNKSVIIIGILIVSLLSWLATIRILHNSQKKLLINNENLIRTEKALRQSEASFRELFENANDIVYTTDLNGNFTSLNKLGEILTGYTREEAVQMNLDQVIAPECVAAARKNLAQRLKCNSLKPYQIELITKQNERIALEISNRFIHEDEVPVGVQGIARDITVRKNTESALHESQQMLKLVMDTIPHAVFWKNRDSVYLGCNQYMAQIAGFPVPEKIIGLTDHDMPWKSEETELFLDCDRRIMTTGVGEFHIVETLKQADGKQLLLHTNKIPLRGSTGEIVGVLGTFEDVTERKQAEIDLYDSEFKLRTLLESMSEGLIKTDESEVIEFVNDRICEMTGFSRNELIGKTTYDITRDEETRQLIKKINVQRLQGISGQYEINLKTKSGENLWVIVGGAPIINVEGKITGTMGIFTDITVRKRAEEQLIYDAFHDNLTGLANRNLFMDHLQLTIERGRREIGDLFAVLFLDFDRFKIVNDSLGHTKGDKLLTLISERLKTFTRTGDVVARMGGDEFTILFTALDEPENAMQIAERILEELQSPFDLDSNEVFITASIGIALSTAGYNKAEDMLRDADIAMYRAKAKGKAQYQVFDQKMHKNAMTQLQLETEMRQGFERGEFCLYYQPIFNLKANSLAGFEALLRWNHPERGLVSPGEFIPAAEENGLILPLGRWILYESCRQMREWQNHNSSALTMQISVNLSCKQFQQPDLVEQVMAALIATRMDARCLKLEITESHLLENSEMSVTIMNRLRELGVELSLDDFGTGYSSLSYLHRLPVTYLKIDRSFVSRMVQSRENAEIVNTIIKLAQNLKMQVIAEGIETADQFNYLKELNCEYGQGYLFSRPLDADSTKLFIDNLFKDAPPLINEPIINLELNM